MQLQQKLDQLSKVNKSKIRITTVIFFIEYFCLHGILPFSKSCLEIGSPWPTAKCRRKKSFDTWYYIAICATLCVSFWSKLKATNVFPKHILKSKARDQPIQARKKLFCHVILKNYLCNVLCRFLIKIESTWRREIKEQAPQVTLLYCGGAVRSSHRMCTIKKTAFKYFAISTENTCVEVSF